VYISYARIYLVFAAVTLTSIQWPWHTNSA